MATASSDTPHLSSQLPGLTSIVAGHAADAPGVAWLELARPERHNAFHQQLWEEFPKIVVAGQGRNFCAGIDVAYLANNFMSTVGGGGGASGGASQQGCPGAARAAVRQSILALQDAYTRLERCTVPVIAAVQGCCIGGGIDLITACDMRVCSSDATFCVKEVDLAIAADLGTLQRLPHIVGHGAAMDLALTARTIAADEALRLGLVAAVFPAAPRGGGADGGGAASSSGRTAAVCGALRLAARLAAKPSLALQGTKRVLLHARDNPRVADGLDYIATWNSAMLLTNDLARVMSGGGGGGRQATARSKL